MLFRSPAPSVGGPPLVWAGGEEGYATGDGGPVISQWHNPAVDGPEDLHPVYYEKYNPITAETGNPQRLAHGWVDAKSRKIVQTGSKNTPLNTTAGLADLVHGQVLARSDDELGFEHIAVDEDEEYEEERAGPWKSGYGEYPYADEIYDLTHSPEPDVSDPGDDNPEMWDDEDEEEDYEDDEPRDTAYPLHRSTPIL